jgi:predicted MFS family arabinose efflux permease
MHLLAEDDTTAGGDLLLCATVRDVMRKTLPIYVLFLVSEIVWMAIVPVAPSFADRFHLSKVEVGALLASAGLATLLIALPIGLVSDRIGTRRLIRGSAAVVALSTLGQGVAVDFWSLLAARACFGVGLGTIWTAGLAWLADAGPKRRQPSALGGPVVVAGIGIMVGPALAGLLADQFGLRAPFLVLAIATAVVFVALLIWGTDDASYGHEPLMATLAKARRDRVVLGSLVVIGLIGLVGGGVNLLVPLGLKAHGYTAGDTGLVLTGASIVFVAVSLVVTRLGHRAVSLWVAGLAAVFYAAVMTLTVASESALVLVCFAIARAPAWAVLSTVAYPLGALGARQAGLGSGAIMGVLNVVWGAAGSVGPLLVGAVAETAGSRTAFVLLVALLAAAGVWLLASGIERADEVPTRALREDTS